jgi:hypothetical protein
MSQPTDFGTYIKENKALFQRYVETRIEILRLKLVRSTSRAIGSLIWLIVLLFLLFLFLIFTGLTIGFLFAEITGSNVFGFLIATGFILLFALLISLFRNKLFINPVVRLLIGILAANPDEDEEDSEDDFNS